MKFFVNRYFSGFVFLFLLGSLLSGCLKLFPGADLQQTVLLLEPGPITLPHHPQVTWQLLILPPQTSAHLKSNLIAVEDKTPTVQYVEDAVWSDDVVDMVQNLVLNAFLSTNKIMGVSAGGRGVTPTYGLSLVINKFGLKVRQSPENPMVIADITAQIIRFDTRKVVSMKRFSHTGRSKSQAATDVAQAFDNMLHILLQDLVVWTLGMPNPT